MRWTTFSIVSIIAWVAWLVASAYESRLLKKLIILALALGCSEELFGGHSLVLGGVCIHGKEWIQSAINAIEKQP